MMKFRSKTIIIIWIFLISCLLGGNSVSANDLLDENNLPEYAISDKYIPNDSSMTSSGFKGRLPYKEEPSLGSRAIIGDDGMVKCISSTAPPTRYVARMVVAWQIWNEEKQMYSIKTEEHTAWLFGENVAITRADNVINRNSNAKASSIYLYFGCNGESYLKETKATRIIYYKNWYNQVGSGKHLNFAILPLEKRVGKELGYLGFEKLTDAQLLNKAVTVTGYPHSKNNYPWKNTSKIVKVYEDYMWHSCDTLPGQEGSPLTYKKGDTFMCVGLNTFGPQGSREYNTATRIEGSLFNLMNLCKKFYADSSHDPKVDVPPEVSKS